MPPRVVLVTGVSRHLGARVAARLAAEPGVERVIGVDTVPPRGATGALGPLGTVSTLAADGGAAAGRVEFVRADIRNPLIAKVIAAASVDTVVHMNVTSSPEGAGGRSSMKEINVIGTMQLLAACQKAPSMRKLVVKSTSAVYGTSSRDPAMFTEDMAPKAVPRSGYAKDAVEVEGYVRGFGRRRPDVTLSVLRFTNVVGPRVDSPLTRYLALPVVPTVLGYDPRLQLCHEDDAVDVLRLVTADDRPGIVNVGGHGVLLLSQAVRRAGRVAVAVPSPAVQTLGRIARRTRIADFTPDQLRFLEYGRVVDTTRLRTTLGFTPSYSTAAALDDFVRGRGLRPVLPADAVDSADHLVRGVLGKAASIRG